MRAYRFEAGAGGTTEPYQRLHTSEIRATSARDAVEIATKAAGLPLHRQRISVALLSDERGALIWIESRAHSRSWV